MRNKIYGSISVVLAIIICISVSAFGMKPVAVKAKIRITKQSISIKVGKSIKLKVKGTKKKVTWESKNKKIAVVNKKGRVTAKKVGKTIVIAKVGKKKLKCKVRVMKAKGNKKEPIHLAPSVNPSATTTPAPIITPILDIPVLTPGPDIKAGAVRVQIKGDDDMTVEAFKEAFSDIGIRDVVKDTGPGPISTVKNLFYVYLSEETMGKVDEAIKFFSASELVEYAKPIYLAYPC